MATSQYGKDKLPSGQLSEVVELIQKAKLEESDECDKCSFVDTHASLSTLIDSISNLPNDPPPLYIDVEGVNLSRHGSISILQIFVLPQHHTYLIDVYTLQSKVFSTTGKGGLTLKNIFESNMIPKVFFDVRNDSDALYSHFSINLQGVQDLQLMELATRNFSKRCINGLSKCIERDAPLGIRERFNWMQTKEKGRRLFAPEIGGTYEVFNKRPLPRDIMLYCAQDVQILYRLWALYDRKLSPEWRKRVFQESEGRIKQSQSSNYNGKGRHMAMAPPGWA